ncbi:MAG: hypothetical protein ACRDTG_10060, partial [Pseudonocardiaceae bacterium]
MKTPAMSPRAVRWRYGTLVLALALVTSCGGTESATGSGSADGGTGGTTYPLTITNCGSTEIFTKAPERVLT